MSQVKIPDAWITEWNVLFVIPSARDDWGRASQSANAVLAEWDYPIQITPGDLRDHAESRWVDPAVIEQETWPDSGYSPERVDGWVEVYRVDIEDLPTEPID